MKIFLCLAAILVAGYAAHPFRGYSEYENRYRQFPQEAYNEVYNYPPLQPPNGRQEEAYKNEGEQADYRLLQYLEENEGERADYRQYQEDEEIPQDSELQRQELANEQLQLIIVDDNYLYEYPDLFYYGDETCPISYNILEPYFVRRIREKRGLTGYIAGGSSSCDNSYCPPKNDYISVKFFNDHICVHKGTPPQDLTKFCREFRPEQPLYQAMVVTPSQLQKLRDDMRAHQQLFKDNSGKFPPILPPPSQIHFYTTGTYTFIECQFSSGKWKGKQLSDRYQQYIPRGTPEGVYQIYHGCPPVKESDRPGISAPGPC